MNLNRLFVTLGLLLVAIFCSNAAQNFTLQIGNITWVGGPGGYNPFSATAYPNTVNFTITKNANGNKSYSVMAGTSATSGSYTRQMASGANRLNYQLYTTSAMTYVLQAPTM